MSTTKVNYNMHNDNLIYLGGIEPIERDKMNGNDQRLDLSDYPTNERSAACYEREITELKQQRDDLLRACKRTLGAMSCDELNNGQVFNDDLRKEVKNEAETAITKAS